MTIDKLAAQAGAFFEHRNIDETDVVTPIPGLLLLRHMEPTPMTGSLYEPVICLILQGRKETVLGTTSVHLGSGQSMVVSHDLPVQSRITQARPDEPYLAMILTLDVPMLRGLYESIGAEVSNDSSGRSLEVYDADDQLIDSLGRYLGLARNPIEAKVLAPSILREIHFRLLMAPHGGMLRRLLRYDSNASRISRAISRIRRDYRNPLSIPDLASSCGMSESSFYKQFREITSTTPLQYQKQLRLLEARRLLSQGEYSVAAAAFEVGYESPNQFSREYARVFGSAPRKDVQSRRNAMHHAALDSIV